MIIPKNQTPLINSNTSARSRINDLILFLLLLTLQNLFAQEKDYIFNAVTIEDGLSSNKIFCFLEDSLGRMWIGTDNGLNKYDGTNIEVFYNTEDDSSSIIHNIINTLERDYKSANIWIGTSQGLCQLDIHTYKASTVPKSIDPKGVLSHSNIIDLAFDPDGTLWIATAKDLFKLDSTLTNITRNPNGYRRYPEYSALYISPSKEVFVGGKVGISKYNNATSRLELIKETKDISRIKKIFKDSDGDVWVGTAVNGALMYKDGDFHKEPLKFTTEEHQLMSNLVWDVEEYEAKRIFLINKEAGIAVYNKNKKAFEYIKANPLKHYSLEDKAITTLTKDTQGNLWVGSYTSGISYIDKYKKPFIHYTQGLGNTNLFNDNVRSFFEDSEGYIWVGIKQNGGISRFDPKTRTFKYYPFDKSNPNALQGENVTCIDEIDSRYLLVGTFLEGLHVLDRKTGRFKQYMPNADDPHAITDYYIIDIDHLPNGKILVAHGYGLDLFDFKNETFKLIFNEKSARSILVENEKTIWIGTLQGLYLITETGKIKERYNNKDHDSKAPFFLSTSYIADIEMDSDSTIWVGSGTDGLYKLSEDKTQFTFYKNPKASSINRLKAMAIDNNDNIWFSSKEGLSVFYHDSETFDHYTVYDGLQSNEFETHAGLTLSNGQLLFGGRNGFNIFHPDSIRKNPIMLPVVINTLKVFNKTILPGDDTGILSKHISYTKRINLSHKQSMISLEFSAVGYSSTENNSFAYIMEGSDNEWIYTGNNRTVSYANLDPGTYTFRVKAANCDGLWNNKDTSLVITVSPPWWRTPWFYSILSLLIIGLLWLIIYLRVKQLQTRQRKLERKVNERTQELYEKNKLLAEQTIRLDKSNKELTKLNATKDKLFSIVAHDLRNPLSSILGISELLDRNYAKFEDEKRQNLINSMAVSMKKTFHLLETLLNWSRSQSHTVNVLIKELSPYQEIDKIKQLVEHSLKSKHLTLKNTIPEPYLLATDPNLFEVIFRNLITNAIKFSSEGSIDILFTEQDETITIAVEDCGVGMSQECIDSIFNDQYSQSTAGTSGELGTGLGLSICKEFITKLNGTLSIKSEINVGSSFQVTLPKKFNT